ncbi:hypothetical protein [Salinibacillus xinjiangensis]|uniref:DUF4872 domain-containing protein n=1 Tax=Salinibacillus xinjiangensis TaxID=1229268 RepID=A0A6G1X5A2_9BACI|nr:hypothetical protein [Salinibacillus xinjiangensis]MRG86144.1 hypothetical protein [Salinibacillus xinjiangensis]
MSQQLSCENYNSSWTSAATALLSACRYYKPELTMIEFMGYSGHAFRININADDVDVAGPTGYDWESFFRKGLSNLGFTCRAIRTVNFTPPSPQELTDAMSLIQNSIDKGIPAICWDMFIPEFGNIYGYDDDKKEFMAKDPGGNGTLPYEKLGRGQINELFVMSVEDTNEMDKSKQLKGALELAIDHAYQRVHEDHLPPYENGIKGYDAWIQAFQKQQVSDFGNAYNVAVVHDARRFAAKFFSKLAQEWDEEMENGETIKNLAFEASKFYDKVVTQLELLVNMYPFPDGGNPNHSKQAQQTIEILGKAKQAEEHAVQTLENMLYELK